MKIFLRGVLLVILCASGASATITYNSYVDLDDGFYRVTGEGNEPTSTHFIQVDYNKENLTINMSDTVMWLNSDIKNLRITIMSQQELWSEEDSYIEWNVRKFSYRFDKPGVYGVYVKENVKFHQTIIVNTIYDSFGNIKIQEPTDSPIQEMTDLDPLVVSIPYVVRSYSQRPGTHLAVFMGILFIIFLIIGISKIALIKIIGILRNEPRKK